MTQHTPRPGGDPLLHMDRLSRLAINRAWYEETIYAREDSAELYPLQEGDDLKLRVPTARIITNRHLGLEINVAPQFKVPNVKMQTWLNRILKLNGVRGTMRAASVTKSWAGDVGVLFAYKPDEKEIFGTSWQVGFIEPETYEIYSRHPSGVFKEVDIYTFADRLEERTNQMARFWKRTRFSRQFVTTWPEVRGVIGSRDRPAGAAFDAATTPSTPAVEVVNSLGVIPFAVIQNIATGTQSWGGASDYQHSTQLFHRLNVHLDGVEQGEQIRNRLMLALIDAEEVDVKVANGLTALDIKSKEDGTDSNPAQLLATPLLNSGGSQLAFFSALLDLIMEAAGVAQTGSAKEIFGNEAASSSALKTFFSMQTAVAQHKRENWLGERSDFGMSAVARKMMYAARKVDSTFPADSSADLDAEEYELSLEWPPMFPLSAPEKQTLASVAQQAGDDGVPAEYIAPLWGQIIDATSLRALKDITGALAKRQEQQAEGVAMNPPPKRGILGSGQGDGLGPNGGSATATVTPPAADA